MKMIESTTTPDTISSEIAAIADEIVKNGWQPLSEHASDNFAYTRYIASNLCKKYWYTGSAVDRIQEDIERAVYRAYHNRV